MKPDPQKAPFEDEKQLIAQFWLRVTVVICLFLAALTVLDAFITLFAYWTFLAGRMEPDRYKDLYRAFQQIHQSPFLFIAMNLYNIVVWNGVIVSCIWLLRYHTWARKLLKALLGTDMIVTVAHLLWESSTDRLSISSPGWFIAMNAMQVGAIIALSHPRIMDYLEGKSVPDKKTVHSYHNSD